MRTKTIKAYNADDIDMLVKHWDSKLNIKFTQTHYHSYDGGEVFVFVLFYEEG